MAYLYWRVLVMQMEKININNCKTFQNFSMIFNGDLNIIVGGNEIRKSTFLEEINLRMID
jgi:predicted ATP-dependent endonuclease of OLD family